ncbi:MAG: 3-deoxy-D-manno-octulosonic acid kinase [Granulosicoccaceae bacterium]
MLTSELENLTVDPFDLSELRQSGAILRTADGRGSAWFVRYGDTEAVLRHYYRGGLAGRVSRDRFVWLGLRRTRAFAEYRLLEWMLKQGLPVPEPLGARVERAGAFYTCDLITRAIPGTQTLAQRLRISPLEDALWSAVGEAVWRVHASGVWHADLNAKNLLLDEAGDVYLIDFDRCRRRQGKAWQQQNLARLQRSLEKLLRLGEINHYSERCWQLLLSGYVRA